VATVEFVARVLRGIADRYFPAIALVLILVFALFGPRVFPIQVNNTLATLLEQGTPQETIDLALKKTFGDLDEVSILAYHDEDLFSEENLRLIASMTDQIAALEGVRNCFSLSSTPFFRNVQEDGVLVLRTDPLIKGIPGSRSERMKLKADAVGNQLFVNNIISRDGRTAAFNIIFQPDLGPFAKEAVIRHIRRLTAEAGKLVRGRFYLTGMHAFMEITGRTMTSDVRLFSFFSVILLFVSLLGIFRNLRLAMVGIFTAGTANGLLFTALHLLGRNLSISTTPVPAITMGLALAYTLHILVAKHEGTLDDPEEAQEIFVGALFSGLTSFIGFLSLCLNSIPTLQDFGFFAAIGTFCAGWSALFVGYPVLKRIKHRPHPRFARRFKFFLRLATARYRHTILAVAAILLASGAFIGRMEVQTDYYRYYLKSSPMTKAVDFVNRTIGGQYPIIVAIDTGEAEGVYREDVLRFLEDFKQSFERQAGVDKVITYLDLLNEGYRAFVNRTDPGWYADSMKVAQMAMIVRDANVDLNGYYVDASARKTLLFVRTNHINSAAFIRINQHIRDYLEQEKPRGTVHQVGGTYLRCVDSANNMAISQFEGTFWEIIVLFSTAFLIIRSVRLTAIAIIANLIPVFGVYGLLSLLGETLNMGTTTIAAISLGIGVDDTIHYVVRYMNAYHKTGQVLKSTRTVIRSSAMSMFLAASMIALSFLSLSFSNIKPIFQLGVFTVVTMALCFAANMFLVPVLITMWEKDARKKGSRVAP
jgi:hypothetical protein